MKLSYFRLKYTINQYKSDGWAFNGKSLSAESHSRSMDLYEIKII